MHTDGAEEVFRQICTENAIADSDASIIQYVVHILRFGDDIDTYWRRVDSVYEIGGVTDGVPRVSKLIAWREEDDSFVALNEPRLLTATASELAKRAEFIDRGVTGGK